MATVLSGIATHVKQGTGTDVISGGNYQSVGVNTTLLSFRLDGKPVCFKSRSEMPSISEGDTVAAAGKSKGGTLHAEAVRNVTTGAIYAPPRTMPLVLGVLLLLISLPLVMVLIGLLFLPIAVWVLYRVWVVTAAINAVQAVTTSPVAPAAS